MREDSDEGQREVTDDLEKRNIDECEMGSLVLVMDYGVPPGVALGVTAYWLCVSRCLRLCVSVYG